MTNLHDKLEPAQNLHREIFRFQAKFPFAWIPIKMRIMKISWTVNVTTPLRPVYFELFGIEIIIYLFI